jgi:Fe-S-cluster containining protein
MTLLAQLHLDIETRVQSIRGEHPDWPCGKGCDRCCHRLAEVPQLTAEEWHLLQEGLTALPQERLAEVRRDLAALAGPRSRPLLCPLLDQSTGACPVYAQRPVACRTYGFYVQRDKGLYCQEIESRVADGFLADVVWGNHEAIDHRLAGMGETRSLIEWFKRWVPDEYAVPTAVGKAPEPSKISPEP